MVLIPAGPFLMGSDEADDERPVHRVDLSAYRIGKYPVTNIQFARFVEATGYRTDAERANAKFTWRQPLGPGSDVRERMDRPVAYLTWRDALYFVTAVGKRLPTEAEWEKAARGPHGRRYPWGERLDVKMANLWRGKTQDATPVWLYAGGASPYGVMDMVGNVPEWCSSLGWPYPYEAGDGREDLEAEGKRVVRGGSWYEYRASARNFHTGASGPRMRAFRIGVRVAESVGQASDPPPRPSPKDIGGG